MDNSHDTASMPTIIPAASSFGVQHSASMLTCTCIFETHFERMNMPVSLRNWTVRENKMCVYTSQKKIFPLNTEIFHQNVSLCTASMTAVENKSTDKVMKGVLSFSKFHCKSLKLIL